MRPCTGVNYSPCPPRPGQQRINSALLITGSGRIYGLSTSSKENLRSWNQRQWVHDNNDFELKRHKIGFSLIEAQDLYAASSGHHLTSHLFLPLERIIACV